MKQILLLFLSLLVVFTAVGCQSDKESIHNHKHDNISDNVHNLNSSDTVPHTGNSDSIPNTARGVVEGNTYTNNYISLKFTKPESWVYLDKEAVRNNGDNYDMMVVNHTVGAGVFLAFEDLRITAGTVMTAKEYVENVIKAGISNTPYSTLTDQTELTIRGNTYTKVTISIEDPNTPITKYLYLREVDGFMVQLTASIPTAKSSEVDFDSMLS